jgi:hypothetical protein
MEKPRETKICLENVFAGSPEGNRGINHGSQCGELNYLNAHAFWNISDLGVKCKNCGTINTITVENGELRKQV